MIRKDAAISDDSDPSLGRTERRLLRRIFNGRTVPIITDGRPFLTYKEASRYLLSLPNDAREQAYAQISRSAASGTGDET